MNRKALLPHVLSSIRIIFLLVVAIPSLLIITEIAVVAQGASTSPSNNGRIVIDSSADLEYDENGKLTTHALIYSNGKCADLIEDSFINSGGSEEGEEQEPSLTLPYGYVFRAVEGDVERDFFGNHSISSIESIKDCNAICIERGVDQSLVSSVMNFRRFEGNGSLSLTDWFSTNCQQVEVGFINYWNENAPLNVYWSNPSSPTSRWMKQRQQIGYGETNTYCFHTYIGQQFKIEDDETKEVIEIYTVEHTAMKAFGDFPPYRLNDDKEHYTGEIKNLMNSHWNQRKTFVKRSFSPLGFRKGRLPKYLFASMNAFYYNNRNNRVREEFSDGRYAVNWWEADVFFIQVPWKLKTIWQEELKDLVQTWVGNDIEVEQTAMYGMRQYTNGSRLVTHIDTLQTHAVSLIINIDQGNLIEPWPIDIYDHANRLHQITMDPGDIVYYESAKCLHGRHTPLKGEGAYYVNLFTHYRPKQQPGDENRLWYREPNPENAPQPLIDIGECNLKEGMSKSDIGIGAVQCENPNIGPYLSPSMFTATGSEDLYRWWRATGGFFDDDYNNNNKDEL